MRSALMPITVEWDDEAQTVVRWDFVGRWNFDDVKAGLETSITLRKSIEGKSSVILNFERSESLPMGAVTEMMKSMAQMPDKREMVVIAGSGALLKNLVGIYLKVRRGQNDKIGLVDTLEQARAYIAQHKG
jgi:hypothetical protein